METQLIDLEERRGSVSGVGSSTAEGIGALHFRTILDISVAALAANFAYIMSMADPDTMTLKEALNQPDAEEFLKAMVKEVEDHVRREHWKIMTISEMIASGYKGKPIMGVWSSDQPSKSRF